MSSIVSIDSEILPDLSSQGYIVEEELGNSLKQGRVTYRAVKQRGGKTVVVRNFQFTQTSSSWFDCEALEKEVQLLRKLNHSQIPQYLDSFQTDKGFCLVQEYKYAKSLVEPRNFTTSQIQQIAKSVLEILVYLQEQKTSIIHRNIKPENILVDEKFNVYLINFGLAKIDAKTVAQKTIKSSLGFMSPEQMFNRNLNTASDLYSLGVTLICLLSKTPPEKVSDLVDENYRISLESLLPNLDWKFRSWLAKMVEPNPQNRFCNAASALKCLKPIANQSATSKSVNILDFEGLKLKERFIPLIVTSIFFGLTSVLLGFLLSDRTKNQYQPAVNPADSKLIDKLQIDRSCVKCDFSGFDYRKLDSKKISSENLDFSNADFKETDVNFH